ncbi:transposase [Neorhizobium sp. IRS_2294]|uniref:transposase n=1 Tax=unclassified Neorhizobium TaxID=2629175 RepID=UPI003D287D93
MARTTKVGVGYNIQLAVDVKHKLIAEQEVSSQVVDMCLLTQTTEAAMDNLGVEQIEVVADRVYLKVEDIEACKKAGITTYVTKPLRGAAVREGFFPKDKFRYDAEHDVYVCPAGQHLSSRYEKKTRDLKLVEYCNREACRSRALKAHFTHGYRRVGRVENEAVLDRMAARLAARPGVLDLRRESVEHPFGTIKQWMYMGAFLMRRLENVRGELRLTALAYNIRRAITLVGVPGLIAAVRM